MAQIRLEQAMQVETVFRFCESENGLYYRQLHVRVERPG
jgi:hypothetical protein